MENLEEYCSESLQKCSYRILQQTAKRLGLPSNVKKVYLIQLIHAKKHYTGEQVDSLVRKVRLERQQLALVRKRAKNKKKHILQSTAVSSTSNSKSPPIAATPKRVTQIMIRYSPDHYLLPKKFSNRQIIRTVGQTTVSASDRVLRSRSAKNQSFVLNNRLTLRKEDKFQQVNMTSLLKKRNFSWRNGNEIVPVSRNAWKSGEIIPVCSQNSAIISPQPLRRQRRLSGIYPLSEESHSPKPIVSVRRADGTLSKLNAYYIHKTLALNNIEQEPQSLLRTERDGDTHCLLRTERDGEMHSLLRTERDRETHSLLRTERDGEILSLLRTERDREAHSLHRTERDGETHSFRTQERETQTLSLLRPQEREPETLSLLRPQERDGESHSLLSIEPSESTLSTISISDNFSNTVSNISLDMSETSLSYENTSEEINTSSSSLFKENQGEYTVYYHKKIRAEQVRCLRSKEQARSGEEGALPKINDVFSKFSDVYGRDAQPIYIQVDNNPETASNLPVYPLSSCETSMLERLYNLKSVFVVHRPLALAPVPTTSGTRCVYSTPLICTAKAQPSFTAGNYVNIALPQDSPQYYMEDTRDLNITRNFRCEDVPSTRVRVARGSSSDKSPQSQELGANVTIPEMVEDALELISQDGDYMERMGMDVRVQCVLCQWAGPKIILEYHIRNEHGAEIWPSQDDEWIATFTLGALAARRQWLSRVLQLRASALYVLSARYDDPDCFCATLSAISNDDDILETGSITTYNKVTGEPFTWKGIIQQLPPDMSACEATDGLMLELSRMNLLPNSANLKLMNRELVIQSPSKVVVGQPELDNIHITLNVKIYD